MALSDSQFSAAQAPGGYEDRLLRDIFTAYRDNSALRAKYRGFLGNFSGANVFGHDFANDVATGNQEVTNQYRKRSGETQDQWIRRLEQDFQGIRFVVKDKGLLGDQKFQDFFKYDTELNDQGQTSAEAARAAEEAKRTQTMKEIEDFASSLLTPLSDSDPEVQRLSQLASSRASSQARLQGVQGPMSVANTEQAVSGALGGYNMDRKQLAMQALSNKHNAQVGQFQQQQALARQKWEDQVGLAELKRARDPGGTIAGLGGAVLGGVGGFFAGGPAGAVAGATGGFNLGRGAYQGLSGGGYVPPPPNYGRSYGGF